MPDSSDNQVQLTLGFDTTDIAAGGKVYVETGAKIQAAATQMATTHTKAWSQMTKEELLALQEQDRAAAAALAQRNAQREADWQATQAANAQKLQQARLLSGQLAQEYLKQLQAEFKAEQQAISTAVEGGLISKSAARDAARANAEAYNTELRTAMAESGGLFQSIADPAKQQAALAAASGSLQSINSSSNAASLGLSRLRYSLSSVAATATGLPPVLGRVAGTIGVLGFGMTTMIALLAAVIAVGEAFKYMSAPQENATKDAEKYTEVAKAQQQGLLELKDALGALASPELKMTQPTNELQKLQDEIKKTRDLMESSGVRNTLSEFWEFLKSPIGGKAGDDTFTLRNTVAQLGDEVKKGTLSLQDYIDDLQQLGSTGGPAVQKLTSQFITQAETVQGLIEKMAVLRAQNDQAEATRQEQTRKYGSSAFAATGLQLSDTRAQTQAVSAGGPEALKAVQDQQKAVKDATEAWSKYVETVEGSQATFDGRNVSTYTFNEALKAGIPMAQTLLQQTEQLAKALDDLAAAQDRDRKQYERFTQSWAVFAGNARGSQMELLEDEKEFWTEAITVLRQGSDEYNQVLARLSGIGKEEQTQKDDAAKTIHERAQQVREAVNKFMTEQSNQFLAGIEAQNQGAEQAEKDREAVENKWLKFLEELDQAEDQMAEDRKKRWQQEEAAAEQHVQLLIQIFSATGRNRSNNTGGWLSIGSSVANSLGNAATTGSGLQQGAYAAGAGLSALSNIYNYGESVGASGGSAARAGLGGAASGAAAGAEIGSVIPGLGTGVGAAIGAIAGFTTSLLGAKKASEQFAIQLQDNLDKIASSLASYQASITHSVADEKAAALLSAKVQYEQLVATIESTEAGKKLEAQRNADLAEANTLYNEQTTAIQNNIAALMVSTETFLGLPADWSAMLEKYNALTGNPPALVVGTPTGGGDTGTGGSGGGDGGKGNGNPTSDSANPASATIILQVGSTEIARAVLTGLGTLATNNGLSSTQWTELIPQTV